MSKMRVVVATDKFKGCLPATEVAEAVARGILDERPDAEVVTFPVADGGDGTVGAAVSRGFTRVPVVADGPTGEPVSTGYATRHDQAVVELANVCGLDLLPGRRPDPLGASTFGLGQVLRHAIENGSRRIVLGIGGSASTDGGAGMVQALGARLLDRAGAPVPRGGAALAAVETLEVEDLRRLTDGVRVTVASDVDNPLLGARGAAAVFGPQKGADPADLAVLEAALTHWARVVSVAVGADHSDRAGAGAAGGTGFAAIALLGAELASGIELVLELLGFEQALTGADLVITGEGALDEQSLAGKAPVGVADAASRRGIPVVAVAGVTRLTERQLRDSGIRAAYPLSALEPDPAASIASAPALLRTIGRRIAADWRGVG